jgi:hypothetical protein
MCKPGEPCANAGEMGIDLKNITKETLQELGKLTLRRVLSGMRPPDGARVYKVADLSEGFIALKGEDGKKYVVHQDDGTFEKVPEQPSAALN